MRILVRSGENRKQSQHHVFFNVFTFSFDEFCQTFSCLADNVDVNAVSTSTNDTTHACSTKLKICIEGVFFGFLIHGYQFFAEIVGVVPQSQAIFDSFQYKS